MTRWLYKNLIEGLKQKNQELKEKLAEAELEKVDLQELLEGAKLKRRNLQGDDSRVQVEYEELTRGLDERRFGSETGRTFYESVLSKPGQLNSHSNEHLFGEFRRIHCLLWLRVQRWRSEGGGPVKDLASVYIPDEKVDRLLQPTRDRWNGDPTLEFLDRVEMEHVVRATRREFQKNGKLVRPETFGEYRGTIE
ncbi:hypothetical protein [Haladaptatus sp. NG-SE-30]